MVIDELVEEELKAIAEKYPFVIGPSLYKDLPPYNWYSDMPIGWHKAFGYAFLDELLSVYNAMPEAYRRAFHFMQLKEKYGTLRVYAASILPAESRKIDAIIAKYEKLSSAVCIKCGKPATHLTKGWIMPVCDNCDKK